MASNYNSNALVQKTQQVFDLWEAELIQYLSNCDDILSTLVNTTKHFDDRLDGRSIQMEQILYVLQNLKKKCLVGMQTGTRKGIFKMRLRGIDFDGQYIIVVLIPNIFLDKRLPLPQFKLITCFYDNKKEDIK